MSARGGYETHTDQLRVSLLARNVGSGTSEEEFDMRNIACAVLLMATAARADSLEVVHSFSGPDGQSPTGLIQASNGFFYGVGANGGDQATCDPDGCGVVFSLGTDGAFADLHLFDVEDGYQPTGLVEAKGKFYGTTFRGGADNGGGGGVLYGVAPKFKVIHRFGDGFVCCGPAMPTGHLVKAKDGKLYGTSNFGGDFRDVDHGNGLGTIWRFDPRTGDVAVIHSFSLNGEGIFPTGPLFPAKDGFLYGTTRENEAGGSATLFKIDTAGNFSVVAQLPEMEPVSGVIQGRDGAFYGTDDGGAGKGSLFKVDGAGQLTVLNRFDGADGRGPRHPLVQASDGFFYGTTTEGGLLDPQAGVVFRLSAKGELRILHSFDRNAAGGILPNSQLVENGIDGLLYGTAALGGEGTRGTVFRIDPADLGPVASLSLPDSVQSGENAKGKVKLFQPAPAGGMVVSLGSQGPLTLPASVKVPEGATVASFRVKTMKIGAENDTRIYASVKGQGVRAVLRILP